MKRCLQGLVIGLICLASSVTVLANTPITVVVDGSRIDFEGQPPVIVDGRTLVPVRGVFEQLGFDVEWDGDTRQVRLGRPYGPVRTGWQQVVITIDSADFRVYTEIGSNAYPEISVYSLEVPAQIIGGRTMLPLRAVLESVGYYLGWDGGARTVLIGTTPFAFTNELPTQEAPASTETPPAVTTSDVFDGIVGRWFLTSDIDRLNEVAQTGAYDGLGFAGGIGGLGGADLSIEILSRENGYITVRGTLIRFNDNHRALETRHEIRETTVGYIFTEDGRQLVTRHISYDASPVRPPGSRSGAGTFRIWFMDDGVQGLSANTTS